MNTLPLIRANVLFPMMRLLNQENIPSQQLLQLGKLPDIVLDEPEILISLYQAFNTVERFAHREGIELLGVLASQQLQLIDIGLFGKVVSQSLTGYDLLQTIVALLTKTYSSGVRVWLTQDSDKIWFNHQYIHPTNVENQQFQYYACLLHLRAMQLIMGSRWFPTDLHFQADKLPGLSQLELFSTARVRFNQLHNAIAISKLLLYLPIKRQRNNEQSNLQDVYEQLLVSAPTTDFIESLQQFIQLQLQSGYSQIEITAEAAGISVRSLQRRLSEEGLNYSRLLDQVRFKLAADWLKDPKIQLVDIAFGLGYTTPANFTRAFQRWAGISPSEYRRLQLLQS